MPYEAPAVKPYVQTAGEATGRSVSSSGRYQPDADFDRTALFMGANATQKWKRREVAGIYWPLLLRSVTHGGKLLCQNPDV